MGRGLVVFVLSGMLWSAPLAMRRIAASDEGKTSPQARFREEAPRKWEEFRRRAQRLQGSYLSTSFDRAQGGKVFLRTRYECKQNERCALCSMQDLVGGEREGRLECLNPRYGFRLYRAVSDSPWAVVGLDKDVKDGYGLSSLSPGVRVAGLIVEKPLSFSSMWECLLDMVRDPDFVIQRVSYAPHEGDDRIRVDFKYRPKMVPPRTEWGDIQPGWNPLRGGWILLDPARYWVMHGFEVETEWQDQTTGTLTGTFMYQDGEGGFPILKRSQQLYKGIDKRGTRNETESVEEYELTEKDIPDEEFTLSAFGLPEPSEGQRPTRWFIWIGLAGIAFVGLTMFLRRLSRRAVANL